MFEKLSSEVKSESLLIKDIFITKFITQTLETIEDLYPQDIEFSDNYLEVLSEDPSRFLNIQDKLIDKIREELESSRHEFLIKILESKFTKEYPDTEKSTRNILEELLQNNLED